MVDNPCATSFATSRQAYADLPRATEPTLDLAGARVLNQHLLESPQVGLRQKMLCGTLERRRIDELEIDRLRVSMQVYYSVL